MDKIHIRLPKFETTVVATVDMRPLKRNLQRLRNKMRPKRRTPFWRKRIVLIDK